MIDGPTYRGQRPEDHTAAARNVLRDALNRTLEGLITQHEDNNKRLYDAEAAVTSYQRMVPVHEARIAEFREALAALDAREAADAPSAPRYVAIINTPGYLPQDDEPPTFDTAREAWDYLADERKRHEDEALDAEVVSKALDSDNPRPYSNTWRLLAQLGDLAAWLSSRGRDPESFLGWSLDLDSLSIHPNVNAEGLGSVWGNTPNFDDTRSDHDLGVSYNVMLAEPESDPNRPHPDLERPAPDMLCCDKGPHDHGEDAHHLLAPSDLAHHLPEYHGATLWWVLSKVNTEAAVRHIVDSGIDDSGFSDETRRLMVWHEQFHGGEAS